MGFKYLPLHKHTIVSVESESLSLITEKWINTGLRSNSFPFCLDFEPPHRVHNINLKKNVLGRESEGKADNLTLLWKCDPKALKYISRNWQKVSSHIRRVFLCRLIVSRTKIYFLLFSAETYQLSTLT